MSTNDDSFDIWRVASKQSAATAPHFFNFKVGKDSYSIRTDEIVYMKSSNRTVSLCAWNNSEQALCVEYRFYSVMEDVKNRLPKSEFVHCERSHIVNLNFVRMMNRNCFVLRDKDNTAIPVSRRFHKATKKAYFKFLEKQKPTKL